MRPRSTHPVRFTRSARTAVAAAALALAAAANAQTASTSFTYQGQIKQSGSPLNGSADVQFRLYTALTGGSQIGATQSVAVTVTGGIFSTPVNFGDGAFDGTDRFLEIAVRSPAGSGTFTTLTPRQAITAAPYALALRLPLSETVASANPLLALSNSGSGGTIRAFASNVGTFPFAAIHADGGNSGRGIYAYDVTGEAILGDSWTGRAIMGYSGNSGYGTYGSSQSGAGALGENRNSSNVGRLGTSDVGAEGVAAQVTSTGVVGTHTPSGNLGRMGTNVNGVYGWTPGDFGTYSAVHGESQYWQCHGYLAANGSAVKGDGGPSAFGVWGEGTVGAGVYARSNGTGSALDADWRGSGVSLPSQNNVARFRNNGGNVARIDNTGRGFFNGGTQTSGADVAEAMTVEGDAADYQPGDVLVISTSTSRAVTQSRGPYCSLVAGVYATKPGVLLTDRHIDTPLDGTVPCGVVGIIPTKVCAENGAIRRGDLLVTSSIPGCAMKGTDRDRMLGAILGKALEDFDGDGTGLIEVMVNTK